MTEKTLPRNHVMAVISGSGSGSALTQELRERGFRDVASFQGEELADTVDAKGEHSNPFSKVLKALEDHVSEQGNYLAQYQEEARHGQVVVAVHVKDAEDAERAREVLDRHGAHNIRFFTASAVADLSPLSNPTPRSAESPEKLAET